MKMKYDISKINRKHQQLASWLPRGMAFSVRFEDGIEGQPPVTPATPASPVVEPVASGEPAAPVAPAAPAAPVTPAPPSAPAAPTAPVAPAAPAATLLDAAGLINPDGTFVKDWHKSDSLPEEVRGSDSLGVIKTLSDLAKRTVHAEKMVGGNKIAVPKADATPEEIATFQEAVGAAVPSLAKPPTADDYKFDVPEGLETLFTDEKMKSSKELAHKIGATQSQFEQFMQADGEAAVVAQDAANLEADRIRDEKDLALKTEWANAYLERIHLVKRVVAEHFGSDEAGRLDFMQNWTGEPVILKILAGLGARIVESKGMIAELTASTPNESLQKIKDLRATPGYMSMGSDMTDERRTEITNQIREQHTIAYPEKKT
ncbi:MAG: hypothetical protein QQN63_04190 [Nitrosopumilus sp.]